MKKILSTLLLTILCSVTAYSQNIEGTYTGEIDGEYATLTIRRNKTSLDGHSYETKLTISFNGKTSKYRAWFTQEEGVKYNIAFKVDDEHFYNNRTSVNLYFKDISKPIRKVTVEYEGIYSDFTKKMK